MSEMLDEVTRKALREPFPKELIGKLPGRGDSGPLDFVNHAVVTDRLISAAPDWTYKIRAIEAVRDGVPHCIAVVGTLTIGGVSRDEVGAVDRQSNYGEEMKLGISDFIRRAAMRFGVALDLWTKEDLHVSQGSPTPPVPPRGSPSHSEPGEANSTPSAPTGISGTSDSDAAGAVGDGEGPPAPAAHIHTFTQEPFAYDGKPFNPRRGWEVCTQCLDARKAA